VVDGGLNRSQTKRSPPAPDVDDQSPAARFPSLFPREHDGPSHSRSERGEGVFFNRKRIEIIWCLVFVSINRLPWSQSTSVT